MLPTVTPTPPAANGTDTPSPTHTTDTPTPSPTTTTAPSAPTCGGDCDGSGGVTINELVLGVSIALGQAELTACRAFDQDDSETVEINEVVAAVNNALHGCDFSTAIAWTG